jgi:hypothetical protein
VVYHVNMTSNEVTETLNKALEWVASKKTGPEHL